jgi:hypothetical protein
MSRRADICGILIKNGSGRSLRTSRFVIHAISTPITCDDVFCNEQAKRSVRSRRWQGAKNVDFGPILRNRGRSTRLIVDDVPQGKDILALSELGPSICFTNSVPQPGYFLIKLRVC